MTQFYWENRGETCMPQTSQIYNCVHRNLSHIHELFFRSFFIWRITDKKQVWYIACDLNFSFCRCFFRFAKHENLSECTWNAERKGGGRCFQNGYVVWTKNFFNIIIIVITQDIQSLATVVSVWVMWEKVFYKQLHKN